VSSTGQAKAGLIKPGMTDLLRLMSSRIKEMAPFSLLIILAFAIFAFNTGVMLFLPSHYGWEEALLDSILLVAFLIPVLYFFVFRPLRSHVIELSKVNTELKTQISERKRTEEALRESEKQLRYLSSQLLTTQETERRRLSRELHDELMQSLALLKIRLSLIEGQLKEDQAQTKVMCAALFGHIDEMIEDVRRLSRDLSPLLLEDLGLSAALQWLINNLAKNYNIQASMDIPSIDHLFPQESRIMLYRIFQEALTNIGKHAQASTLSVAIQCQNGSATFSLEDDGKGFDLSQVVSKSAGERGLGLMTMDERVRLLGGALDIQSQEGKGTRLSFAIPIYNDGILE
jgi:signal transduction histidine kinase